MIKYIKRYLGFRDWGIFRYNTVIQNSSIFFYIALVQQNYSIIFIEKVLLFFVFSLSLVAYGYLINDFADVDLDKKAGKINVFLGVSHRKALLIITIIFLFMIVSGISFLKNRSFFILWFLWFLLTTFYSSPPLRLKERGLMGLIATILGQQPLPAILMFSAMNYLFGWDVLIFIIYITLRGISADVGHQMRDRQHDVSAGASTFAVQKGDIAISRLYGISLEFEKILLGLVLFIFLIKIPTIKLWNYSLNPTLPLFLLYILLLSLTIGRAYNKLKHQDYLDPYDESIDGPPRDFMQLIHHGFPSIIIPFYLAFCLTLYSWPNIIFLVTLVLVYQMYQPSRWIKSLPVHILLNKVRRE